jgi:peptide/nickel transport system permease protein
MMARYIARRILQMIPTVFGVILITFILFNLVGGSPARTALGEHASARALEDYDEVRGFNRPLVFGWWTTTRALPDSDFDRSPGEWGSLSNAAYCPPDEDVSDGRVRLQPGRTYRIPLAFPLARENVFRLDLDYRTADQAEVSILVRHEGADPPDGPAIDEHPIHAFIPLTASRNWRTQSVWIETAPPERDRTLHIEVLREPIEIRSIGLRRRMPSPFHSQFAFYLSKLARLDFGVSSSTNQRVSDMLWEGVGPSLALTVPVFLIGLGTSICLSLVCATFRNRLIDRFFVVLAVGLMSINYLVFIIVGQYLFSYRCHWFPVWGFESWRYLVLPVLIGVVSGLGGNLRFYRTVMLDEMYKDYVRTASAKGVSQRGVLFGHVLRNALIPILTNVVIALPFLYTGSLLLESFFGIPGLGYLAVTALGGADVSVIRAIVLIGAVSYVIANLITDICYAWVDPRVTLS